MGRRQELATIEQLLLGDSGNPSGVLIDGVVRYISDIIAVMYLGQIVEVGSTDEVIANPRHPYTKVLLDSVPGTGAAAETAAPPVESEPPDPHDPPPGCRFHPRCPVGPRVMPERTVCATDDPCVDAPRRVNQAACHFAAERVPTFRGGV